ncbi:hypothetical protein PO909_032359 [Leuciscus waleckii]
MTGLFGEGLDAFQARFENSKKQAESLRDSMPRRFSRPTQSAAQPGFRSSSRPPPAKRPAAAAAPRPNAWEAKRAHAQPKQQAGSGKKDPPPGVKAGISNIQQCSIREVEVSPVMPGILAVSLEWWHACAPTPWVLRTIQHQGTSSIANTNPCLPFTSSGIFNKYQEELPGSMSADFISRFRHRFGKEHSYAVTSKSREGECVFIQC